MNLKLTFYIYRQIGQQNKSLGQQFKNNIKERIQKIEADITSHTKNLMQFSTSMKDHISK